MQASHFHNSDVGTHRMIAVDRVTVVTELSLQVLAVIPSGMTGLLRFLNIQSTNHLKPLWGRIVRLGYCQNIFLWHFLVRFRNKQNRSLLRRDNSRESVSKVTTSSASWWWRRVGWKTQASMTQMQKVIQKNWILRRCFKNSWIILFH